jgi:hypothetical protein
MRRQQDNAWVSINPLTQSTFFSNFLFKFTGDMPFRAQMTNIYSFFSYLRIYPLFWTKTARPFWDATALPPVVSIFHISIKSELVSDIKRPVLQLFEQIIVQ